MKILTLFQQFIFIIFIQLPNKIVAELYVIVKVFYQKVCFKIILLFTWQVLTLYYYTYITLNVIIKATSMSLPRISRTNQRTLCTIVATYPVGHRVRYAIYSYTSDLAKETKPQANLNCCSQGLIIPEKVPLTLCQENL